MSSGRKSLLHIIYFAIHSYISLLKPNYVYFDKAKTTFWQSNQISVIFQPSIFLTWIASLALKQWRCPPNITIWFWLPHPCTKKKKKKATYKRLIHRCDRSLPKPRKQNASKIFPLRNYQKSKLGVGSKYTGKISAYYTNSRLLSDLWGNKHIAEVLWKTRESLNNSD